MTIKAITLHPEFAWAVTHLDKRIENRGFTPRGLIERDLLIHAGKSIGGKDVRSRDALRALEPMLAAANRAGWIISTRVAAPLALSFSGPASPRRPVDLEVEEIPRSAIVAVVRVHNVISMGSAPWSIPGMRHWYLCDVRVLPSPVPCSGQRGLWEPEAHVLAAVRSQVEARDA